MSQVAVKFSVSVASAAVSAAEGETVSIPEHVAREFIAAGYCAPVVAETAPSAPSAPSAPEVTEQIQPSRKSRRK